MAATDQKTIEILVELVDKLSKPLGEISAAVKGLEQSIKVSGSLLDQFNTDILDVGANAVTVAQTIRNLGGNFATETPKLMAFAEATNAVSRSLEGLSRYKGFKLAKTDVPQAREIPAVKAATSASGIKNLSEQSDKADESLRKVTEAFGLLEKAENGFFVVNARVVSSFKELVAPLKELRSVSEATSAALTGSIRMLGVLDKAAAASGMGFVSPLQALRNLRESVSQTEQSVRRGARAVNQSFDEMSNAALKGKFSSNDAGWLHMMGGIRDPIHAKTVTTVKDINEASTVLSNTIEKLTQKFYGLNKESATPFGAALREFHDLEVNLSRFNSGAITMGIGLTALGMALVEPFRMAIEVAAKLETEMDRVAAVTNATTEEVRALTKAANDLGKSSPFSAQQVAEGMRELALAGYSVTEVLKAMPVVTNMAAAGFMSIKDAASITSGIMKGFGLPVSELGKSVDILTLASNQSNASVEELGVAFHYVGSIAKTAGMSFDNTTAALAKLHDAGFKGSLAGTALRGAFDSLLNPTKQQAELIDKLGGRLGGLGLQLYTASGQFVKMSELLRQFETAGVSSGEILSLFGQRAGPGMAALLQLGSKAMADFENSMTGATGATKRMADTMRDNLQGSIENLMSALEALGATVGDKFIGVFKGVTDVFVGAVNGVNNLAEAFPALAGVISWSIGLFASLALAMGSVMFAWFMFGVGASKGISVMRQFGGLIRQLYQDVKIHGLGMRALANEHELVGRQVGSLAGLYGAFSQASLEAAQSSGMVSKAEKELLETFIKEKEQILQNIAAKEKLAAAAKLEKDTREPKLKAERAEEMDKLLKQTEAIRIQEEKIAVIREKLDNPGNARSRGGLTAALNGRLAALSVMQQEAEATKARIQDLSTVINRIEIDAGQSAADASIAHQRYADSVAVAYNKMREEALKYGLELERLVTQEELLAAQDVQSPDYDPVAAKAVREAFARQQLGIFQDTRGEIKSLVSEMGALVSKYGDLSDATLRAAVEQGKLTQQQAAMIRLGRSEFGINQMRSIASLDISKAKADLDKLKEERKKLLRDQSSLKLDSKSLRAAGDIEGAARTLSKLNEVRASLQSVNLEIEKSSAMWNLSKHQVDLLDLALKDVNNNDLAGVQKRLKGYEALSIAAAKVADVQILDSAGKPMKAKEVKASVRVLADAAELEAAGAKSARKFSESFQSWFTRAAPGIPAPGIKGLVEAAKLGIRPLFGWISSGLMTAFSTLAMVSIIYDVGKAIYEHFNKPLQDVSDEAKKARAEAEALIKTLDGAIITLKANPPDSEEYKKAADELARTLPELKFDMNIDPFTGKVSRVISDLDQIEKKLERQKTLKDLNLAKQASADVGLLDVEISKINKLRQSLASAAEEYSMFQRARDSGNKLMNMPSLTAIFAPEDLQENLRSLSEEIYTAEMRIEDLTSGVLDFAKEALVAGDSAQQLERRMRAAFASGEVIKRNLEYFREQTRLMKEAEAATTKTGQAARNYLSSVKSSLEALDEIGQKTKDKLKQVDGEIESMRQKMSQDIKVTFDLDQSLLKNTVEQIDMLPDLFTKTREEVSKLSQSFGTIGNIDPIQISSRLEIPKTDDFKATLSDISKIFENLGTDVVLNLGYQIDSVTDASKWMKYKDALDQVSGSYSLLGTSGELAGKFVQGTTETLAKQAEEVSIKYSENGNVVREFTGTLQQLEAQWQNVARATSGPKAGQDLLKGINLDSNVTKSFPVFIRSFTEQLTLLGVQAQKSEENVNKFLENSRNSYARVAAEAERSFNDQIKAAAGNTAKLQAIAEARAIAERNNIRGMKEAELEADSARLSSKQALLQKLISLEDQYRKQQEDLAEKSVTAQRLLEDGLNAQKGKPTTEFQKTKREVEDLKKLTLDLNTAMAGGDVEKAEKIYDKFSKIYSNLSDLKGSQGANEATSKTLEGANSSLATYVEFLKKSGEESGKAAEKSKKMIQDTRSEIIALEQDISKISVELSGFKISKDFETSLQNLIDKLNEFISLMEVFKKTAESTANLKGIESSLGGLSNAQEVLSVYKEITDSIKQYQSLQATAGRGADMDGKQRTSIETRIREQLSVLKKALGSDALKSLVPDTPISSLVLDPGNFDTFAEKAKGTIDKVRKYALDQQIDVAGKLMSMQLDPNAVSKAQEIQGLAKTLGVESKIEINAKDAIATFDNLKNKVKEYLGSFSKGELAAMDNSELAKRLASTIPNAMKAGFSKAYESLGDASTSAALESEGKRQAQLLTSEFKKMLGPDYANIFDDALKGVEQQAQGASIEFLNVKMAPPKVESPIEPPVIPQPDPVTAPVTPEVVGTSEVDQKLDEVTKDRTVKVKAEGDLKGANGELKQKVSFAADATDFDRILAQLREMAADRGEAAARSLLGTFADKLKLGSPQMQQAGEAISKAVADGLAQDTQAAQQASEQGVRAALAFSKGIVGKYDENTFSTLVKRSLDGVNVQALAAELGRLFNTELNSYSTGVTNTTRVYEDITSKIVVNAERARMAYLDLDREIQNSGKPPTEGQIKELARLETEFKMVGLEAERYWSKTEGEVLGLRTALIQLEENAKRTLIVLKGAGDNTIATSNYEAQIKALDAVISKLNATSTTVERSLKPIFSIDGIDGFDSSVEDAVKNLKESFSSLDKVSVKPKVEVQGVEEAKASLKTALDFSETAPLEVKVENVQEVLASVQKVSELLASFGNTPPIKIKEEGSSEVIRALQELKSDLEYLVSKTWTIKTEVTRNTQGFNSGGLVPGYADGGVVQKFATGGSVFKVLKNPFVPGVGNKDTVPAMLTPGEFVIDKITTARLGVDFLKSLRNIQFFSSGGLIRQSGVAYSPIKTMTQKQLNERAPHSGKEDTVNLNLNLNGKNYPLNGPRDTVKGLVSALNHVNSR